MSHNPNTVKSQDELNEGGRKSDVLIEAIDELSRLKAENEQLKHFIDKMLWYSIIAILLIIGAFWEK